MPGKKTCKIPWKQWFFFFYVIWKCCHTNQPYYQVSKKDRTKSKRKKNSSHLYFYVVVAATSTSTTTSFRLLLLILLLQPSAHSENYPQNIWHTKYTSTCNTIQGYSTSHWICNLQLLQEHKANGYIVNLTSYRRTSLNSSISESTYFQFRNGIYWQKEGCTMTDPISAILCGFFMEEHEQRALMTAEEGFKPLLWKRYVADILEKVNKGHKHNYSKTISTL